MKYLYLPLTALILTLSHIACSTDNHDEPIVDNDVVEMTIVAEQTRTHLSSDGSTVEWDATGEYLMVYQTTEGNTVSNKSREASVVDGLAQFGVTFQSVATAQSFEYNAIYPASSVAADATPAVDDVLFTLPVVQSPTSSSFDNSADLLVARRSTTTSQPESLSMAFKRLVAISRLTLAGIDDLAIKSVELRIPGAPLAGSFSVNLPEGRIAEYSNTSDCVTIAYSEPVPATTPIFFTLLPVEIGAGESFTVTVVDANDNAISREVALPEGRSLSFSMGDMTKFTVNIENKGSEEADFASIAGEWHLAAWCGMEYEELDFDIYLDIDTAGSVTLWQRLAQHGWEKYLSTATLSNGVISGVYSDGVEWGGEYNLAIDGDTMTWTNTLDATDVSIYKRCDIPEGVEECEPMSVKLCAPML